MCVCVCVCVCIYIYIYIYIYMYVCVCVCVYEEDICISNKGSTQEREYVKDICLPVCIITSSVSFQDIQTKTM